MTEYLSIPSLKFQRLGSLGQGLIEEMRTMQKLFPDLYISMGTPFAKFIIHEDVLYPLSPSDQDYILETAEDGVSVAMTDNTVYIIGNGPNYACRMKLVSNRVESRLKEVFGRYLKVTGDDYES